MARKRVGQLGLGDGLVAGRRGRTPDQLMRISGLIDWAGIEGVLAPVEPKARGKGKAGWPSLVLFKALLLQRWYDLSDEALEASLSDRLSFLRFCGLSLDDDVPDHSTIWRFRERLGQAGLVEALFAELQRQLESHGVLVKRGTLIDATLIKGEALWPNARRPRMEEDKVSKTDPDARFGANNERRRYEFGYKAHIGMDQGSGLVRRQVLTPANAQEISQAEALIVGDEGEVLADRGYDARALHDHLAARGIGDGVMRRGLRNNPLPPEEVQRNHEIAPRRRKVEKVFGTLKRIYKLRRLPYFSQARNAVCLAFALIGYNLRRLDRIIAS
jgi:IS5 family transposase